MLQNLRVIGPVCLLLAALLVPARPALAQNDPDSTLPVNITIAKTLSIKFTGTDQIKAVVKSSDLDNHFLVIKNNGLLHWNSNVAWKITMVRTRWLKLDNPGKDAWNLSSNDIRTYVKKTVPPPGNYVEVTQVPSVWFTGVPGKDHTDQIDIKLEPIVRPPVNQGTYQMTISFTIAEN